VAATWPLARDAASRLAGDRLDPLQTLWGFWFIRRSWEHGVWPTRTDMLWWPDGVPLWFQTWDIPSAVVVLPLWGLLSDVSIYNVVLFATFPLSGYAMFALGRELQFDRLSAFVCGAYYTFSSYHFAAATSNLHIASMQWSPLFLCFLLRASRTRRSGDALIAGVMAGLATLASLYHAVFCALAAPFALMAARQRGDRWSLERLVYLVALALASYAIVAGWLVVGLIQTYQAGVFAGEHDPMNYSADLLSFVVPNAISVWSGMSEHWRSWSGTPWSTAPYVGAAALAVAIYACAVVPGSRVWLAMAGMGALLALGPYVQIGGQMFPSWPLPYAWLERAIPGLAFGGIVSRFAWLTLAGVAIAIGAALTDLRVRWRASRPAWIGAIGIIFLLEAWPRPMPMSHYPRPTFPDNWLQGRPGAVLDMSADPIVRSRALWHQMFHERPIFGGYITRWPRVAEQRLRSHPAVAALHPLGEAHLPGAPAPSAMLTALRQDDISYVIVARDSRDRADGMGLSLVGQDGDLLFYEVPGASQGISGAFSTP